MQLQPAAWAACSSSSNSSSSSRRWGVAGACPLVPTRIRCRLHALPLQQPSAWSSSCNQLMRLVPATSGSCQLAVGSCSSSGGRCPGRNAAAASRVMAAGSGAAGAGSSGSSSSSSSSSSSDSGGGSRGAQAGQGWLGQAATVAGLLPVVTWGVTWAPTMGLMHCGYALLVALTHLGTGVGVAVGMDPRMTDCTDLALRVAQQLSSPGTSASPTLDLIPWTTRTLLVLLLALWRGVQGALDTIRPDVPSLLLVSQLSVAAAAIIFAVTLTPLRPILAALAARAGTAGARQGKASGPRLFPTQQQQDAPPAGAAVAAAAERQAVIEECMRGVGQLSLVMLLTAAQASGCFAPDLAGPPSAASSLFAVCAPVADLILPVALAVMAGVGLMRALTAKPLEQAATAAAGGAAGTVDQAGAAAGTAASTADQAAAAAAAAGAAVSTGTGRVQAGAVPVAWDVACVARAVVDVLLIGAQALGGMEGHVSAIRLVGTALLLRLVWRAGMRVRQQAAAQS